MRTAANPVASIGDSEIPVTQLETLSKSMTQLLSGLLLVAVFPVDPVSIDLAATRPTGRQRAFGSRTLQRTHPLPRTPHHPWLRVCAAQPLARRS